jgi:acyl-coenzyme A thioesterase PaaI-like protein
LIDEIASWVVFRKLQTTGVTDKLEVKFMKPIMTTENQITLRARLVEMKRQVAFIEVKVYNSQEELCTEGKAVYFTANQEKAREMGFSTCELEGEELLF